MFREPPCMAMHLLLEGMARISTLKQTDAKTVAWC